jgi:hypothetical protein
MTVLAANSTPFEANWKYKTFTLTSGQGIAYQGAAICYRPSTSKCVLAQNAVETDIFMGFSVDKYDATSADVTINVDLIDELRLHWVTNGTSSDAVQATDVGKHCYWLDDQTVSILPTGHTLAGRIWAVDATKGVLVQKSIGGSASFISAQPAVGSYTTNNYAPAAIVNGATYDVPTTGAASTITLPAAAQDGTIAYFAADGTKNGHTVQYVDATGSANLTTALTASKRHLVVVNKRGGKWFANAYVSP